MDVRSIITRRAEHVADRVQAGWDMLDKHRPRWGEHVDVYALDLADASACVLAQVYNEEWEAREVEFQAVLRTWLRGSQDDERPEREHFDNPYSYGLREIIAASGTEVVNCGERDIFARQHGWLSGSCDMGAGYESIDDEELSDAWKLALRAMGYGTW